MFFSFFSETKLNRLALEFYLAVRIIYFITNKLHLCRHSRSVGKENKQRVFLSIEIKLCSSRLRMTSMDRQEASRKKSFVFLLAINILQRLNLLIGHVKMMRQRKKEWNHTHTFLSQKTKQIIP